MNESIFLRDTFFLLPSKVERPFKGGDVLFAGVGRPGSLGSALPVPGAEGKARTEDDGGPAQLSRLLGQSLQVGDLSLGFA